MQPEFRLLDHDERWWIGVDEDRQQAKVSERTIGLATRGNREVAFRQTEGQQPAVRGYLEVVEAWGMD